MAAVVIGVDPAKRSNTIEVIDSDETVLVDGTVREHERGLPQDAGAGEAVAGPGLGGRGRDRCRSAPRAAAGLRW